MNGRKGFSDAELRINLLNYVSESHSQTDYFVALEARYAATSRRVDVLVVCEHTHAYEIKSDADRLNRLSDQLSDYRHTFDFVTVVSTEKHLPSIKKIVSKNDGIIIANNDHINSPLTSGPDR